MQTYVLIVLFFCHFIADFTHLSTKWMLDAKKFGSPLYPIVVHAWIHAMLMGIALTFMGFGHWMKFDVVDGVFLFQLTTHFILDTCKGKLNLAFVSLRSPANKWHWVVFGADQYFHAVVIILISYFVVHY